MSLAGVPALAVHRGSREEALRRGTVLFFHGLGGSKEVNERELGVFAERGLFAVGLDAVGQGERRYADFDERFAPGNPRLEEEFLQVVEATANEVPGVLDALVSLGADPERLGISGVSQGGFICYRALLLDRRLRVAVALLGSPEWALPMRESPHHHLEDFFPVALFSQTAGLDDVVHPSLARNFHERLEPLYARAPERLRYREFPLSGHMMRPEDWDEAIRDAADWLLRFLA
jgi:hypothetical protein